MNIRKFYDIRKSGRGFTDFWVCKKAVRYYGMGAAGTLPLRVGIDEILTNT